MLLLSLLAATTAQIDFAALARESLERFGYEDDSGLDLARFLDGRAFLRCDLGGVDLRIPVTVADDKHRVKEIADCVAAVVEMQGIWLRWVAGPAAELGGVEDDLERVARWAGGWTSRDLSRVDPAEEPEISVALDPPERTREALERVRAAFVGADAVGVATLPDAPDRLVLAPGRESFLRVAAVAGLLSPEERPVLWHSSMATQMSFWAGPSQVVAMEYVAFPLDPERPFGGFPMEDGARTRQRQHVVDRAAATLLRRYLYLHDFHFLETALASNLVLATVGENDLGTQGQTKDYQRAGRSTPPYSRFVPGGNPAGGVLPSRGGGRGGAAVGAAKSIPRWFRERGRDHYAGALREARKAGAKTAARADSGVEPERRRLKQAHFEILSRESGREAVVSAPFFGPDAKAKKLPGHEFLDDYEDFFASYRSAFFHWVRTEAVPDDEEAARRFAELLRRYVTEGRNGSLAAIALDVYGEPLSAPGPEPPSLEWRFLDWL